ncbi:MAG: hypothetical protein ACXWVD_00340 [Telluria sp.]
MYEHIARNVIKGWPADAAERAQTMRPELLSVAVEDGEVVAILPSALHRMFDSGGFELVGLLLDRIVPAIPDGVCLVLLSEAWVKFEQRELGQPLRCPADLSQDAEAGQCVMVNMYRPHATRIGRLMLDAQRRPVYGPLEQMVVLGGRLVPETGPAAGEAVH